MQITEQAAPPQRRSLLNFLFGKPLASDESEQEQIGALAGIPIFGLDALSSVAYGPEAALTVLLPLGIAASVYLLPLSLTIIVLLGIVFFSYRQTIAAYPQGAGSYTVASENLGAHLGLLAGTALMLDYILNVAVGISAGVGALVSAVPELQKHTLLLCLGILALLTLVNLRGVRDAGVVFMAPTYFFLLSLGGIVGWGLVKALMHGGHPGAVVAPVRQEAVVSAAGAWLLIKAFASGCTAMTGVEAVSNGVQAFREPRVRNARVTLSVIIALLMVLLAGIAYLGHAYGVVASVPGQVGYQTVLSQLTAAVSGRGVVYYVTMVAILIVLALSANTSFADFPRLCRAIAEDGYLPFPFTTRGRRLVYSFGVYALSILAALLLIAFDGVTDRLIPLFAVGAFLAFTLSQAGMVVHWKRKKGAGSGASMLVNGLGALATGLTTCVVIVAKFTEGAWITVLIIPGLYALMMAIHRHYQRLLRETETEHPANLEKISKPLVVLPLQRWSRVADKALRFAYTMAEDVYVVHIAPQDDDKDKYPQDDLLKAWKPNVEEAARKAGLKPPELVVLRSPYRLILSPIRNFVCGLAEKHPECTIAVVVPEIVEKHWFYYLLHNQRAAALKLLLYMKGDGRIVVVNVAWHVDH